MVICERCGVTVDESSHSDEDCRKAVWNRVCPPLYRQTDPARLKKAVLDKVLSWKWNANGMVLVGPSGRGKTRLAFLLLHREHMSGRKITCFDCVSFGHACAKKFHEGDGEEWIERLSRREIVFFDDIDKAKFTERVETEMFGVIEKRIANMLPIIATTQLDGINFGNKFNDPVRGQAVVRRLREFCEYVPC